MRPTYYKVGQDIKKGVLFKISRGGEIVKYRSQDIADGIAMRDLKRGEVVYFGPEDPVLEAEEQDTCKPIIVEAP